MKVVMNEEHVERQSGALSAIRRSSLRNGIVSSIQLETRIPRFSLSEKAAESEGTVEENWYAEQLHPIGF